MPYRYGISHNLSQFLHQLAQVLLVGLTIGLMRTVVPALAETEFGVPRGSFLLLTAFVVAFGVVKGGLNFVAGRLSERWGRRPVLLLGWWVAVPIPLLVYWAPSWGWIVFAGYGGVALAGLVTAYLAAWWDARTGLLVFGLMVIALGLLLGWLWGRETLDWAKAEASGQAPPGSLPTTVRYAACSQPDPGTWEVFAVMSWRDRRLAAISQAGLVEKFVDALIWVFYPVYLYDRGLSLPQVGWIIGLSDRQHGGRLLVRGHQHAAFRGLAGCMGK